MNIALFNVMPPFQPMNIYVQGLDSILVKGTRAQKSYKLYDNPLRTWVVPRKRQTSRRA